MWVLFPFLLSPCSPMPTNTHATATAMGHRPVPRASPCVTSSGTTTHSRLYMSPRSLASRRVTYPPGFGPIDHSSTRHQPETSLSPGHKVARKVGAREVAAALQHLAWVSSPHTSTPSPPPCMHAVRSLRSVIAWRENGWDVAIVRVLGVLLWGQCQPDPPNHAAARFAFEP